MSKSILRVPTTEISRHFGDYLSRVRFGGSTIVVLKNDSAVAELRAIPSEECALGAFLDIWAGSPVDDEFAADLEAVGRADRPPENPWA
jgi:hypothetical protein